MNSGKVLIGVFVGIAVGAALGILLAPDKGTVIRKKISKKRDNYMDEFKSKFGKLMESIADNSKASKKSAINTFEKGELKMQNIKSAMKNVAKENLTY